MNGLIAAGAAMAAAGAFMFVFRDYMASYYQRTKRGGPLLGRARTLSASESAREVRNKSWILLCLGTILTLVGVALSRG